MHNTLAGHVFWKDMIEVCGLPPKFKADTNKYRHKNIGGSIYIEKNSIKDPILRLEVENCKPLDGYYPLSSLMKENGLSDYTEKKMRKSHYCEYICNTHLFKIPEVFFNNTTINKKMIILSLVDNVDDEESSMSSYSDNDFETVVEIFGKFKIAGYTL